MMFLLLGVSPTYSSSPGSAVVLISLLLDFHKLNKILNATGDIDIY